MTIKIRLAQPEDAEKCGAICFEAFAAFAKLHNFPPDMPNPEQPTGLLKHLISRDDFYTTVAEIDGKIVGSNVLWENGEIAGVGPITVDPSVQHGSVGKILMTDLLERCKSQGFESVRLVQAAYNNISMALYTKLGFDVMEPLSLMNRRPLNMTVPGYEVRQATKSDVEACHTLCQKIHGHSRKGDLADALHQQTATVVERNGQITGYASVIGFWGHAVGETNEDIKALICAATEFAGPGILVPTRNGDLMRWCLANDFKIVQPMSLMAYGPYQQPKGAFLPSIIF